MKKDRLVKVWYWLYSYSFLLVYIILLLLFIYLKSQLETILVYVSDMSYNLYLWNSILINFIEFINIGIILSGISKMNNIGKEKWEKNEEFLIIYRRVKEQTIKMRQLKIKVIFIKIKSKILPIKYKLLKWIIEWQFLIVRTMKNINIIKLKKQIKKKDNEIRKKQEIIRKKDKKIEELKIRQKKK